MRNKIIIFILIFSLISCQDKINPKDLHLINGYWEIEKVTFKDGLSKKYSANSSYDYFEIDKENKGIRKKVIPQFDGSYVVNDTYETIKLEQKSDKFFIHYKTPFSHWSEELVVLTPTKMQVINADGKKYYYRKTTKIDLSENGKKK